MSNQNDMDWEKYYEDEKLRLDENYSSGVAALDKSKQASQEMAAVTRDRLLKYLPGQLKSQGIHTQGVSEDATIKALNNYQNTMTDIAHNYDTSKSALSEQHSSMISALDKENLTRKDAEAERLKQESDAHYTKYLEVMGAAKDGSLSADDIRSIASVYGKFSGDEIESLISAAQNNYEEISNIKSYPETFLADSGNFNSDGGILPEAKDEILNYLEENRATLGESLYNAYKRIVENLDVATPEATADELDILKSEYKVKPGEKGFDAQTAKADDIIATLDVATGKEQTAHVENILEKSKSWGADKNGTIENFNYGINAGLNSGNYFVFYNGRWYPTEYTNIGMLAEDASNYLGDAAQKALDGIKSVGSKIVNGITGIFR